MEANLKGTLNIAMLTPGLQNSEFTIFCYWACVEKTFFNFIIRRYKKCTVKNWRLICHASWLQNRFIQASLNHLLLPWFRVHTVFYQNMKFGCRWHSFVIACLCQKGGGALAIFIYWMNSENIHVYNGVNLWASEFLYYEYALKQLLMNVDNLVGNHLSSAWIDLWYNHT